MSQQSLADYAELQQAIGKFEAPKNPTFLPLLKAEEQIISTDSALPSSMAGGSLQASSLAGILEELGYSSTSSSAAFQDVLRQVDDADEAAIASMIGMMMRTHSTLNDLHGTQVLLHMLKTVGKLLDVAKLLRD